MRSQKLDALRGMAILLMVAFHANYLLVHIFENMLLDISSLFWFLIWRIAVGVFLLVSGAVFFLSERNRDFREVVVRAFKRSGMLAIVAAAISISTFFFAPDYFIVFGIIHFFAVSSLLLPIFMRFWTLNIVLGILVVYVGTIFSAVLVQDTHLYILGLRSTDFRSGDYYPIFPWFGVVLFGYGITKWLHDKGALWSIVGGAFIGCDWLALLGRHSLLVYILHVPILYGIFSIIFGK